MAVTRPDGERIEMLTAALETAYGPAADSAASLRGLAGIANLPRKGNLPR